MALCKSIHVEGLSFSLSYWRISVVNIDFAERTAHCELVGYIDRAHRETRNSRPFDMRVFDWAGDNFPVDDSDAAYGIRAQLYAAIKNYQTKEFETNENGELQEVFRPGEFSDAVDC